MRIYHALTSLHHMPLDWKLLWGDSDNSLHPVLGCTYNESTHKTLVTLFKEGDLDSHKNELSVKDFANMLLRLPMNSFNSTKELPLDSLEVVDIQREPTYHSEYHNLFYDIVTKIYRCSDGFVGVRGVYRVNTEDFGLGILNIKCSASEYKETKVTVFIKK